MTVCHSPLCYNTAMEKKDEGAVFSIASAVAQVEASLREYPDLIDYSVALHPPSAVVLADRLHEAFLPLPPDGVFCQPSQLYEALASLEMCFFRFPGLNRDYKELAEALLAQVEGWWVYRTETAHSFRWTNSVCRCEVLLHKGAASPTHRHNCFFLLG